MRDDKDSKVNRHSFNARRGPGAIAVPAEKAKDFKGTLKRLGRYLKPHRGPIVLSFLMACFGTVFSIFGPKVMGMATDSIYDVVVERLQGNIVPMDYLYLRNILALLAGLYILFSVFTYLMQFLMVNIAQKTVYNMRKEVSEKLTRLPLRYFDTNTHGEILSRVTNDIDNISNTLQQSLNQMITSIVSMVGIIIMMLTINWMLTLVTLVTLPLSVFITSLIAKKSQKHFKDQQKTLGMLNGHIEEMYTGHKVVKAFNYEGKSQQEFDRLNEKLYYSSSMAQFISGTIMPLMTFVGNLGYVIVAAVGSIFVSGGTLTLGSIQAFIQYSRNFSQPIIQIANIANVIQSTIASAERVFEVLDEEEEIPESSNLEIQKVNGRVTFEHVRFSYDSNKELIRDLNINVQSGQTVAIVGPTGAGKTTLVNLLMRFYDIQGGKITIDGHETRELSKISVRNLFGMVLQDTWLFKGTIRDNIAYGRLGASECDVIEAAKTAYADHFIRTLPDGYDTILNEEADNISQGQKQLLTIARAILANPQILILDEATSSVDTRTEKYIQKAAERLMKGRTNFVIAHRLSTIVDADLILVMNDGDIIEQGNHLELMLKKGFYHELYSSQFLVKQAE
ncbi:MAG: ABC transporter ATP-binding protein/permease [Dethiosulfatibacter sp.]|nr:ABC transporter ATP-binding protein/permease [Dethiosulfatibacter sp.]